MRIINLASGSKGNCTFVCYNDTKILIDVGLNEKQFIERLDTIGEKINDIVGVCITHEHIDHIRAMKTLSKKYEMDFYIHKNLAESSQLSDIVFKEGKLHKFIDQKFNIGDLEIHPFDTSHDAVAPVGFTVNVFGSKSKFGIMTDTGVVFDRAVKMLEHSKIVFIESNYDEKMLMSGSYPQILKQRVAGNKGHLSNKQSLELAKRLYESGTKCFVLSHLSENNNTPELAFLNYAQFFEEQGYVLDKDVFIRLSYQNRHGNNFSLKEEF